MDDQELEQRVQDAEAGVAQLLQVYGSIEEQYARLSNVWMPQNVVYGTNTYSPYTSGN